FVIPTGSMAPTLLGAHMRLRCEDCGYEYDVNFNSSGSGEGDEIRIDDHFKGTLVATCPNCANRVTRNNPPVFYGDRILVLKYLYLFQQPQRWDVVVFKSPDRPDKHDYSQNYIKRLVGKPGEALMLLDGDLYAAQGAGGRPLDDLRPEDFLIQTKPVSVREALLRLVYHNDYQPTRRRAMNAHPFRQPWTPVERADAWKLEGEGTRDGRVFLCDAPVDKPAALAFDRTANPDAHYLTDWLGYNATGPQGRRAWVNDLELDLFYERLSGDGPLRLALSKLGRTFTVELTPTHVQLLSRQGNAPAQPVGEPVILPRGGNGPLHVEFSNIDYQVCVRVDGQELIRTTPEQYRPDLRALLNDDGPVQSQPPGVRIEAAGQKCALRHLSLWRDTYYTSDDTTLGRALRGSGRGFPAHVARLGPDEYFVLGDNSLISGDARYWQDPIDLRRYEDLEAPAGTVPGRFLLGRAFFVYWPAGYQPVNGAPAIVPSFGKMRFIH
ncbi:MAG: S26 family signal peptidase, partial [Tepidisphaeraceae bacterium]